MSQHGKIFRDKDIQTSLNDLEKCEILIRQEFLPIRHGMPGRSGLKNQQNKIDKFLSVVGVMYVIVNSRKDKGKALKKHVLKDIVGKRSRKNVDKPLKKKM